MHVNVDNPGKTVIDAPMWTSSAKSKAIQCQDGSHLFLEKHGEGNTKVCLIHGSAEIFSHGTILSRLSNDSQIILPHRRGMGHSSDFRRVPDQSILTTLIEDLKLVQDEAKFDLMVGESFGASLAILYSAQIRPSNMILFAPSLICSEQWDAVFDTEMTAFPLSRKRIDDCLASNYVDAYNRGKWKSSDYVNILRSKLYSIIDGNSVPEDALELCRTWYLFGNEEFQMAHAISHDELRKFARENINFIEVMHQQLLSCETVDLLEEARAVNVPCFIIHDREDPYVPFANSQKLKESMGNAHLIEVQGVGHNFSDPKVLELVAGLITSISQVK